MKLLFVNGHLKVGGVEKSLVDILKSIDYKKHQVDLLLFEDYGEYRKEIPTEVNIIFCDLKPTYGSVFSVIKKSLIEKDYQTFWLKLILTLTTRVSLNCLALMRLFIFTQQIYDVAIAYRVGICAEYVSYVAKANKKIVWWHHGEYDYSDETTKRWNTTFKKLDKIVCVSQFTKEMIAEKFKDKINDMIVIPNMLDVEDVINKSILFHPYENDSNVKIVSVGRLSPEKRVINTVYAMKRLIDLGFTNLRWYLIGDGMERQSIETAIKDNGLSGYVYCLGAKENPYPYMADADIFVHPSYVESQGLTVLEALALNKKSIITRSLGIEAFIVDGKNAVIAEQSVDSLVEKIISVLDNNYDFDTMKALQNETVNLFSPKFVMGKFEMLINEK